MLLIQTNVDDQERLAFLLSVVKKVDNDNSQDALVFASVAVARVKLNLNKLDDARRDLDASEKILDTFDSVETIVHAAFYDANASYYQVCLFQRQCFQFSLIDTGYSEKWTSQTTIVLRSYTSPALTCHLFQMTTATNEPTI